MTKNMVGGRRETHHINRRVTQSMFHAIDYAAAIEQPLNTYVVINLRESSAVAATTLFTAIRRKFRVWMAYKIRGGKIARDPPAYVYTFENPLGMPHVNWLLHVPPQLDGEFRAKLPRWVARTQGSVGDYDIHCDAVVARYAKKLGKYILKGTDPAFIDHFYLNAEHAPQGTIWGKRAGVSISLGTTTRRETGYQRQRRRYAA